MKCSNLFCFKTKQNNIPKTNIISKTVDKLINYESDKILTILIVDDADINRFILRKFLLKIINNDKVNIVESNNGLDALEKIKTKQFDVVFMDIKMPKLNGDEVAKKTKQLGIDIIIIGITGQAEVKQEVIESSMQYCLIKPVNIHELKLYLSSILDKQYFKS